MRCLTYRGEHSTQTARQSFHLHIHRLILTVRARDVDEAANKECIPDIVDTSHARRKRAVSEREVKKAATLHSSDVAAIQMGPLDCRNPDVPGCAVEHVLLGLLAPRPVDWRLQQAS